MGFRGHLEDLRNLRPAKGAGNLVVVEAIDSTQRLASRLVREYLSEGRRVPEATVIAYQQTAGRGRRGRPWSSPAGSGVFVTLIRRFEGSRAIRNLPLLLAVSLAEAIDTYLGRNEFCELKWPNDLLIQQKKLGGILIDIRSQPGEGVMGLLGFGINHDYRPEDLPVDAAISLADCASSMPTLAEFTVHLVSQVDRQLPRLEDLDWLMDRYRKKSVHRQGDRLTCQVGERLIQGYFNGFDAQGSLRLNTEQGEECFTAGEVFLGAEDP